MVQRTDSQQWIDGFWEVYGGLVSSAHASNDAVHVSGREVGKVLRGRHAQAVTVALTARQEVGREGFEDGYGGRLATQVEPTYEEAYAEGARLREEHADEVEQALDTGRQL